MEEMLLQLKDRAALHHAYLLSGDVESLKGILLQHFETVFRVSTRGNPDVIVRDYDTLSIDDARDIIELASRMPLGEAHYFILTFSFAGTEAQNALLKLLEEPTARTHFFLVVPNEGTLLGTVRSRVFQLSSEKSASTLGQSFLALPKDGRMRMLKEIIDDKDKVRALDLISSLEFSVHEKLARATIGADWSLAADAVLRARRYLQARSASVKMILEYLSVSLPVV